MKTKSLLPILLVIFTALSCKKNDEKSSSPVFETTKVANHFVTLDQAINLAIANSV